MIGRVHWLLWDLSPQFKCYYTLLFDYSKHNYVFYRNYCNNRSKRLKEIFIVIRTSKHCFRVTHYNDITKDFQYKTFSSSKECAYWMMDIAFNGNSTRLE